MIIYPAIDIRGGQCVRLIQGDYTKETVFSKNPVEVAKAWESQGAKWIHMVDLDGARSGIPENMDVILKIRKAVDINIQVGGGIRNFDTVEKYIKSGINRIIFGSAAIESLPLVEQAVKKFGPDKVAVGVDARKDMVATQGWTKDSGMAVEDVLNRLGKIGVERIIYTDISKDGMMKGPNLQGISNILKIGGFKIIASGGVASMEDVMNLMKYEEAGVDGIIIGKALYTGELNLKELLEKVKTE